jgi:hypothetical protein
MNPTHLILLLFVGAASNDVGTSQAYALPPFAAGLTPPIRDQLMQDYPDEDSEEEKV